MKVLDGIFLQKKAVSSVLEIHWSLWPSSLVIRAGSSREVLQPLHQQMHLHVTEMVSSLKTQLFTPPSQSQLPSLCLEICHLPVPCGTQHHWLSPPDSDHEPVSLPWLSTLNLHLNLFPRLHSSLAIIFLLPLSCKLFKSVLHLLFLFPHFPFSP